MDSYGTTRALTRRRQGVELQLKRATRKLTKKERAAAIERAARGAGR